MHRFRLISPKDAEAMATAGTIAQVHSNGRICYEVTATSCLEACACLLLAAKGAITAADGSNQASTEANFRQQQAEEAVAKAEAAVARGEAAAQEQLAEAEAELEEVENSMACMCQGADCRRL